MTYVDCSAVIHDLDASDGPQCRFLRQAVNVRFLNSSWILSSRVQLRIATFPSSPSLLSTEHIFCCSVIFQWAMAAAGARPAANCSPENVSSQIATTCFEGDSDDVIFRRRWQATHLSFQQTRTSKTQGVIFVISSNARHISVIINISLLQCVDWYTLWVLQYCSHRRKADNKAVWICDAWVSSI